MFYSTMHEVPEVVTGSTGLIIVGWAFFDSLKYNKKHREIEQKQIVEN